MSEPSTNIPGEVADAHVDEATAKAPESGGKVDLEIDQDKIEAWDEVKSDYQVDPDAEDTPPGVDDDGMDEGNARA